MDTDLVESTPDSGKATAIALPRSLQDAAPPTLSSAAGVSQVEETDVVEGAPSSASRRFSPSVVGVVTVIITTLAVLGLNMVFILAVTDISMLAAFGFGLYCAFWIGLGFGTIFASAVIFGRDG